MLHKRRNVLSLTAVIVLLTTSISLGQSGHVLNGVGAIDQGLAGAGMAYAQDAGASLHWNPASIGSLSDRLLSVQLQVLIPTTTLSSRIDQGAFGPDFPGGQMAGSTSSQAGPFPIPAIAYVDPRPTSRWAFGLSAFGVGGFGVEYDMDPTNPILTPQAPNGFGFGEVDSQFSLAQIAPTVAYRVNDKVSIGIAPTINVGLLTVSPFPAASPDDANHDGFPSYPNTDEDVSSGYGVQVGIQVANMDGFHFGASVKSTQYFAPFAFDSPDEMGDTRAFEFEMDYPMILSAGVAYDGVDDLVLMADVRYIDFANTTGFEEVGYDQTGAVIGFGWESVAVVALGAQYEIADGLPIRVGYSYNDNPIDNNYSFFNVASPAVVKHRIAAGGSYTLTDMITGSLAIQYAFENPIEGTWVTPFGAAPGTSVESALSTLFLAAGLQIGL